MLKGERITSIQEFLQTNHTITDLNRWVFTYYVIQYNGTNESKQDISRFIGGFSHGSLKLVDTVLMNQHISDSRTRDLRDCIQDINIGDYVCLSCGKFFVMPKQEFRNCKKIWKMKKVRFNLNRFKEYYGKLKTLEGIKLYGKTYHHPAAVV